MKYIKRILGFIPFAILALIGVIVLYFKYLINFIRFGGEAITYTNKNERRTINDIYNILEAQYTNSKLNNREEEPR